MCFSYTMPDSTDGVLRSAQHDDIYFSREDGRAETDFVFLRGNGLPERWQVKSRFIIGELGFGTGLNFLHTWHQWEAHAKPDAQLDYIAIEGYPLAPKVIEEALAPWPELHPYVAQLIEAYPIAIPGLHQWQFGRVRLTLCFGEALDMLQALDAHYTAIDAWYLDGFAPAKNPDMWRNDVLQCIGELTADEGSFATFTAASAVRRGLQAAGFEVQKAPGFGRKRERLIGCFLGSPPRCATASRDEPDALRATKELGLLTSERCQVEEERTNQCENSREMPTVVGALQRADVEVTNADSMSAPALSQFHCGGQETGAGNKHIIIGAGIAGASSAWALAQRGIEVTVLERASEPAQGASGNPAGVLFPQLAKQWTPAVQYSFAAYAHMQRLLRHLQIHHNFEAFSQPGMLKIAKSDQEEERLRQVNEGLGLCSSVAQWLERAEAEARVEVPLHMGGVWYPQGTWVDPAALCATLLSHENIIVTYNSEVTDLQPQDDGWRITTHSSKTQCANNVIIACATDACALSPTKHLPLHWNRGQLSLLPKDTVNTPLSSILCHEGYIIPQQDGYLIGATYDRNDEKTSTRDADNIRNIELIHRHLPQWLKQEPDAASVRASLRSVSQDKLPLIGQLYDKNLAHQKGLYCALAFGSRGLLNAPLAGEILAAQIGQSPLPIDARILPSFSPDRFLRRKQKRAHSKQ